MVESEKTFAFEFIKKLVRAWDPDYTKVTPEEAEAIRRADQSGYVSEDDIDWNSIGR